MNPLMADARQIFESLLEGEKVSGSRTALLDEFLSDEVNIEAINTIIINRDRLMVKWTLAKRINDIIQQPVRILNATVGKPYEARLDFARLKWEDITTFAFEGLEDIGLTFDEKTQHLIGVPVKSGDYKLLLKFKLTGEADETAPHEKFIPFIINPDPKSLWKKVESDRNDPYWKEDDVTVFSPIGDRYILASSKRGRSHANVGSFREDDFAFTHLDSGWSLIAVADGAGSAKFSRKGSSIACNAVIEYFSENPEGGDMAGFLEILQQYRDNEGDDSSRKLNQFVYNKLGKAAFYVYKKLEAFAAEAAIPLKDLNTTLIFTLFKKFDVGYAFLSFGVGDCPIALLDKDKKKVEMMNWLDVGDYGGGTRFITMPEIFHNEKFASRIKFKLADDFSYLMMMSDGVYDAKFVVESNLADIKKWNEFLADLNGKNEDKTKVELSPENTEITSQFSAWMDFWSQGNHDDRTLAIIF